MANWRKRVATPARHIDREKAANFAQALCNAYACHDR
jgi:hypothetical protein